MHSKHGPEKLQIILGTVHLLIFIKHAKIYSINDVLRLPFHIFGLYCFRPIRFEIRIVRNLNRVSDI